MTDDDHVDAEVRTSIPPHGRYALVVRAVVSACGTLEGFSADELGDLRLLANEVFHGLRVIGVGPIDVRLIPEPRALTIDMSAPCRAARTWADADAKFVSAVADVLGAAATLGVSDGRATFTATVRAAAA